MKCSFHFLNAVLCATSPPFNVTITSASILTWLAPLNGPTDCAFNYTINITNYSSSSSYYSTSNTESLILTDDLITHGHNYSFAVAVTDSTGQHGPWSDQLTVTYDGMSILYHLMHYNTHDWSVAAVPDRVSFVVQSLHQSNFLVTWQVQLTTQVVNNITFFLFQPPPPLIAGFPVLHYVVSYNTSDNSTLIHTQVNSSITSYSVSGVPGVTYYITVIAVNALGPGPISDYSIVNGEIKKT